jgi:GMP synthase-like glutamine amidotransferase
MIMFLKYRKASRLIHDQRMSCRSNVNDERKLYGVQFHPEVEHIPFRPQDACKFLVRICVLKATGHGFLAKTRLKKSKLLS